MSLSVFSRGRNIRERFIEALQKYGFKQVDVSKDIKIHHSTLSQWIQGKAKGNTQRLEEAIESWLNNLYSNKPKLAGTNLSRLQLLKGKGEKNKLYDNFDSNYNFDNLIPININIELEGKKFKDIFFWNLNEIISQMKRQISQYKKYEDIEGEILKTIKLDIRIGEIVYNDQIEWDINNPNNSPEEFAKCVCMDLGLGTEFILRISHSIREQILEYQKAAVNENKNYFQRFSNTGNFKNKIDENNYLRDIYNGDSEWQPEVKQISVEEIKKFEKKEERKNRHARRK